MIYRSLEMTGVDFKGWDRHMGDYSIPNKPWIIGFRFGHRSSGVTIDIEIPLETLLEESSAHRLIKDLLDNKLDELSYADEAWVR